MKSLQTGTTLGIKTISYSSHSKDKIIKLILEFITLLEALDIGYKYRKTTTPKGNIDIELQYSIYEFNKKIKAMKDIGLFSEDKK